jgi:8-oxo-dGTP pyrophosphatase MutT (NUDIX family)
MARAAAEALEPLASGVTIVEASTVVCVRIVPEGEFSPRTLSHAQYQQLDADGTGQLGDFSWPFTSGLQVLMGQSEVVNWVRSTPEQASFMRYAAEWKFPGGSVDAGETLAQAAERELSEEFSVTVPPTAVMEPFNVKFTRAIQGKSFTMFNFLCAADENPWLAELDLEAVNARLAQRRSEFEELLASGAFWQLSKEERMEISPEVHRVEWLDLATAVEVLPMREQLASRHAHSRILCCPSESVI